jgi:hypothetical protein
MDCLLENGEDTGVPTEINRSFSEDEIREVFMQEWPLHVFNLHPIYIVCTLGVEEMLFVIISLVLRALRRMPWSKVDILRTLLPQNARLGREEIIFTLSKKSKRILDDDNVQDSDGEDGPDNDGQDNKKGNDDKTDEGKSRRVENCQ